MLDPGKRIIAFAGKIACGKGIANHVLALEWGAAEINYSDTLHNALWIIGIDECRDNIEQLSTFLRTTFGGDVFERAMLKKISSTKSNLITLCGIRRASDFNHIREQYALTLIYIESLIEKRYTRYIKRGRGTGDSELSLEAFLDKDTKEPELQIEKLKELSDIVIENNGTLDEFKDNLRTAITHLLA